MNFKYFLRGLGIGMVFSAVICLFAFQNVSTKKMTDEEIIQKAKDLGMVEKENTVDQLIKENTETSEIIKDNPSSQEVSSEEVSTETVTNDVTTKASEEATAKEKDVSTEELTENKTESASKDENTKETVKLTIQKGTTSFPVSQELQRLGMVEDAAEFDTFLVENGYAQRLAVGTYKLKIGMSYHDIAEAISDPL